MAEGSEDAPGIDHPTTRPTNLLERSEQHRRDHPQHCSQCGQFIGPIGQCKDCFPPREMPEPSERHLDYILDAFPLWLYAMSAIFCGLIIWVIIHA